MEKWVGKAALVTGASAGIGKAIAEALVRNGMKVFACARSEEKLKEHASKLNQCQKGEFFSVKCDVTNEQEILEMFKYIKERFGEIHLCVNNVGICHEGSLLHGNTDVGYIVFSMLLV